tara:strand:- start:1731 stop:1952 length:222 start_codon:yes stop_codon:yes gene_type:complete
MAKQITKLNNVKKAVKSPDPYRQFKEDMADIILRLDDADNKLIEIDTLTGKLIEGMKTVESRVGKVEARLGIG